ncbi:MAG: DUF4276 family protein [Microcoleus sp. SIO2G3]|nr:DUF4276 family protein [Microcoleus sp. SIO2G3]
MKELRYTLLSDGSSDSALIPVLTWLLQAHLVDCAIQHEWADLRRVPKSLKDTFAKRIKLAVELYPCELLFIHRDAEKEPRQKRVDEIRKAKEEAGESVSVPTVCVVPVRMTEAWLLFDETALRRAAANPNGKHPLQLPDLTKLEDKPDPKELLYKLLGEASGLGSHRRKKIRVEELVHRVAEFIDDFASLRAMPAFKALEDELKQVIQEQDWGSDPEVR